MRGQKSSKSCRHSLRMAPYYKDLSSMKNKAGIGMISHPFLTWAWTMMFSEVWRHNMIHGDSVDLMVRLQRHLTRDLRSERSHENLIYLFCNYSFPKCDFWDTIIAILWQNHRHTVSFKRLHTCNILNLRHTFCKRLF